MWQFAIAWGLCAAAVWRQNSLLALHALMLVLLVALFREFMRGACARHGVPVRFCRLCAGRRATGLTGDGRAEHLFPTLRPMERWCLGDVMLLQVGELVSVPAASVAMLAWAGLAAALLAVAGAYWTRSFPPIVVAGFAVFAVLLRLVPPPLLAPLNDMTTFDILAGVLILVGVCG